jgi:type VI secretion system protein ImpC
MPGRLDFSFGFSNLVNTPAKSSRDTMRMLLIGDFSGRENRGVSEPTDALPARPMPRVDVDNFDAVMSRLSPELVISGEQGEMNLRFKQLDDFHPDSLYQRLPLFQALKETRKGLLTDSTYQQTLARLKSNEGPSGDAVSDAKPEEREADIFKRLLGDSPPGASRQQRVEGEIHRLIRDIVSPHVVPDVSNEREVYIRSLDDAISSQMRSLLHHPHFQAVESIWRSTYRVVTGLETDETLQIHLLDASKAEVKADLEAAAGDLRNSGLYRKLVEQQLLSPGGEPWTIIASDFAFSVDSDDIELLAGLGAIAAQAGGPFLARASAGMLGCEDYPQLAAPENWQPMAEETAAQWQALRSSPLAPWIGLLLPRVLLRLPYGENRDEIDSFSFEEMPGAPSSHEAFLWGSPAFACALQMAAELQQNGFSATPGGLLDLEDLPSLTFEADGEKQLMPCAESWISERTGTAILAHGVMPLLSYRNRNAVRLMRLQSIAEPIQGLRGVWA